MSIQRPRARFYNLEMQTFSAAALKLFSLSTLHFSVDKNTFSVEGLAIEYASCKIDCMITL